MTLTAEPSPTMICVPGSENGVRMSGSISACRIIKLTRKKPG